MQLTVALVAVLANSLAIGYVTEDIAGRLILSRWRVPAAIALYAVACTLSIASTTLIMVALR